MATALAHRDRYHAEAARLGEAVRHETMDRYTTPSGRVLPSVTAVLRATEDRSGLDAWRARVGDEEADRRLADGIARGNALHAAVQAALERNGVRAVLSFRPDVAPDPELTTPWGQSIQHVVSRVTHAALVERSAWCDEIGLAGTADLAGTIDGVHTVADWQSKDPQRKGKPVKLSRADAIKYSRDKALQVAAYARILRPSRGFHAERGIVVVASPAVPAHVIAVDLELAWREFEARFDAFKLARARGQIAGWS